MAMLTYTGRAEAEWIRAEGDSTRDVGEMGMVQREGTVAAAVGDGRSESVRRGSARRKREEEDVNSDSGGSRRRCSARPRAGAVEREEPDVQSSTRAQLPKSLLRYSCSVTVRCGSRACMRVCM